MYFLSLFLFFFFFEKFFAIGHMHSPERQRDRKQEITPQGGWPCLSPFSSILLLVSWIACTCTWREFKPPGPGLEPQSATWESSNIVIMLIAGPNISDINALPDMWFASVFSHFMGYLFTLLLASFDAHLVFILIRSHLSNLKKFCLILELTAKLKVMKLFSCVFSFVLSWANH